MADRFAPKQREFRPPQMTVQRRFDEEITVQQKTPASQNSIIGLQRYIGNSGIQRLIQPTITLRGDGNAIHRKGCGCPSCCGGLEDERSGGSTGEMVVQRWWDDDEESNESDSGDSGGSWWDDAKQAASNTWNAASEAVGGAANEAYNDANEASGGLIGGAVGAVQDAYNKWDEWTTPPEDQPVDAPKNAAGAESETDENNVPSAVSTDDGGWQDWVPDWWLEEDKDEGEDGEVVYANEGDYEYEEDESDSDEQGSSGGTGSCVVGHGGHHGNISVEGRTTANFAGANCPADFTPTAKKRNPRGGWDVTGTMKIKFELPEPTIRFFVKPPESELTQCELEAVLGYINGDLSVHEEEHVKAFKLFNGESTFTHTFGNLDGADNTELQASLSAAIDGLVASLIEERQTNAQTVSDGLDPFVMEIPGLKDCSYYDDNPQD
jgi:hypothetical protein